MHLAGKILIYPINPLVDGGGCINNAAKVSTKRGVYLLKWNNGLLDMFQKELQGLQMLAKCNVLNVPKTFQAGAAQGKGYLLMEYIERGRMGMGFWEKLGAGLAGLHKFTNDDFGLAYNNYIGRLPQDNTQGASWNDFFINRRLIPQVKLAYNSGLIDQNILLKFELLYGQLHDLIPEESPALLHGDLWSGNIHCGEEGKPFIIDPAVYYGHREAELAFTRLFGGFDEVFYKNYDNVFPIVPEFDSRVDVYNLYPLLVHVNLFGTSYLSGVVHTLKHYT